jgi:diguanylate cyclase (GGDEF)-like protein/PAS domain S-box-containing protein
MAQKTPVCEHLGRTERYETVFFYAGAAIAIADGTGRVCDINAAFSDMLGPPVADLLGRTLHELFDPSDAGLISDAVAKMAQSGEPGANTQRCDVRFKHSGGSSRWAMLTMTRFLEDAPCMVIVGIDITWRRELRDQLYNQACHDPLTGLPNRRYLEERLDQVFRDPSRTIGACLADLDGFKQINDAYGHGTGDLLLISIAEQLRSVMATTGHVIGRVGGDEFLALVVDPDDVDTLTDVADRMLAACSREYRIEGHRLVVSASIGIAVPDPAHTSLDALLRAADVGLYGAKTGGRGRWRLARRG